MRQNNIGESLALAQKLIDSGKILDAMNKYSEILASHPENSEVWLKLGKLQGDYCLFDDGIKSIRNAIAIDSSRSDRWLSLAYLQHAAGRLKDAKRSGLRAVAIEYELVEAWELLGTIAEKLGEQREQETCRLHVLNLTQKAS